MVRREVDLDDETDLRLTEFAKDFGGDVSQTLIELVRSRESVESILDQCEDANQTELANQKADSEASFREGRVVSWPELKRRNNV